MRIGIFFGGPSREREISFAGGKTAYEHLDQRLFVPVPVFVDSFGRFIRVHDQILYRQQIRDFYPAPAVQPEGYSLYAESFPELAASTVPAEMGELLLPQDFHSYFDFAFLAMHGPDCEDGAIQGLLEWYRIPYSGPGLMGSAVGIDKILQNEMIALANGQQKKMAVLTYEDWQNQDRQVLFEKIKQDLGLPIVAKAPHQGSSIGVAIVMEDDFDAFVNAFNQCFFQMEMTAGTWKALTGEEKKDWGQRVANLDEGIGFPVIVGEHEYFQPQDLIQYLNAAFSNADQTLVISSTNAEDQILLETFVQGQEFSCGCIQLGDGTPFALPPTEVVKVVKVFDFNAKYKPGATRKRIPVDTSFENNQRIRETIGTVFGRLGMNVCARIDGFLTPDGTILLHDPNTIPGMSPTSLIFKQMAEIGLNVTQSLTYFIRQSIRERIRTGKGTWRLRRQLDVLDKKIQEGVQANLPEKRILIKNNDASYRAAQRELGRLGAEGRYQAVPILEVDETTAYRLPLPLMFKEYVEDVLTECQKKRDPVLVQTAAAGVSITAFYAGKIPLNVELLQPSHGTGREVHWTIRGR